MTEDIHAAPFPWGIPMRLVSMFLPLLAIPLMSQPLTDEALRARERKSVR